MYGNSERSRKLMERYRNPQFACQGSEVDSAVAAGLNSRPASGAVAAGAGSASAVNERCGDSVKLHARWEGEGADRRLADLCHETEGCSICRVSADIMCAAAIGLGPDELRLLADSAEEWLLGSRDVPPAMDLDLLQEMRTSRARARCFLLPWEALARIC
ncbi:iron-sulfur cluster assembly scaffold protein [Spirochaeta dissipatitropha]